MNWPLTILGLGSILVVFLAFSLIQIAHSDTITSGKYVIKFVTQGNITNTIDPKWGEGALGYADYRNGIFIRERLPRITAIQACWHEKLHNKLCLEEGICDGEREHEIIYSRVPAIFDLDCLVLWGAL